MWTDDRKSDCQPLLYDEGAMTVQRRKMDGRPCLIPLGLQRARRSENPTKDTHPRFSLFRRLMQDCGVSTNTGPSTGPLSKNLHSYPARGSEPLTNIYSWWYCILVTWIPQLFWDLSPSCPVPLPIRQAGGSLCSPASAMTWQHGWMDGCPRISRELRDSES